MPQFRPAALLLTTLALSSSACAQSTYANPVDGLTYFTPGEFKTYQPTAPRSQSNQRVKTEGIILLTGEPDLQTRTTVQELAAFIRSAESMAGAALGANKGATVVMVQFNCQPKICAVKIASDERASREVLQSLYDSLAVLQPLRTSGEVIFQLKLRVDA